MRPARARMRGFTLIEMVVVVAIIGIVCLITFDSARRSRPRANFNGFTTELQSLVHAARQEALASGVNVVVLVFPDFVNGDGKGRIVVVQDDTNPDESLLVPTATFSLLDYQPQTPRSTANGKVITKLDLPPGILVGPMTGAGVASYPFPFDSIQTDVDCSFCGTDPYRLGAIVFDGRGRTSFCKLGASTIPCSNGAGGSLTVYGTDLTTPTGYSTSTLMITCPQGMLRTIQNG